MKIIKNQETQKIELHFDKESYLALPDSQKKELKRFYSWSRYAGAWVSKSKNNHYSALRIAEKLGFDVSDIERVGERLSYEEELNIKAEKAEARSERYEQYADNAEGKARGLQSDFNRLRGDIAFITQPIIAGHSGSQAFGRQREKIMRRYEKGFDEYRKSEYFKDRAEVARNTANMNQLKDHVYLHNRIKECESIIRKLEKNIIHYENNLHKIENGETIKNYKGEENTAEQYQGWITETLEKMEYEIDKQAFMENCLEEIGGNRFSKDNIKVGYIVKVRRSGKCEVVSTGPINIKYKILEGGAAGMILTAPYAAISEIIEAKETSKAKDEIKNPYKKDDILCAHRPGDGSIFRAYQAVGVTKKGVKIQQIAIENGKPIRDKFINEKQNQRRITKSKFSDFVGVYEGDWPLHKHKEAQ